MKPQRDSLYELGGHLPLGPGSLGVRISHKVSTDWIDDTQVGATNLHQDINFPRGLVDSQSVYYAQPLTRNGRLSSASHVVALNSPNCETQLLQNCAAGGPAGGDLVQADHDQHYDVTSACSSTTGTTAGSRSAASTGAACHWAIRPCVRRFRKVMR